MTQNSSTGAKLNSIGPAAGSPINRDDEPDFPRVIVAEPPADSDAVRTQVVTRLELLWQERRFILRTAFLGAVIGVLLAFLLPTRYQSTTELMPPDSESGSGMALLASLAGRGTGGLTGLAGSFLGLKSSGALFTGILRSRSVQDRIITRFDLKKVYGTRLDKSAREVLTNRTLISEDRKSGIISITVTDRNPDRAAAIARAYVEELDRTVAHLSTSSAHRERVFLEQRLAAVKQELDQASAELGQFESKNKTIDIRDQGRTMMDAAATLMGQLVAAESELKGLKEIYSDNNVRVRSVQARITELRKQLDKIGGSESSPDKTRAGESSATTQSDFGYPSVRELPLLGVRYADLYRRAKIQEAVYETLTQEYELAKVQEAKETPSVKVLDDAVVPETKSFPPRMVVATCSAIVFFLGAIAFLLTRLRWANIDPADPRKVFALGVKSDVVESLHKRWPSMTERLLFGRRRGGRESTE